MNGATLAIKDFNFELTKPVCNPKLNPFGDGCSRRRRLIVAVLRPTSKVGPDLPSVGMQEADTKTLNVAYRLF